MKLPEPVFIGLNIFSLSADLIYFKDFFKKENVLIKE